LANRVSARTEIDGGMPGTADRRSSAVREGTTPPEPVMVIVPPRDATAITQVTLTVCTAASS
jgi:hypothetical protein